jgi:hypothetical protein
MGSVRSGSTLEELATAVADGKLDPYAAAERLLATTGLDAG